MTIVNVYGGMTASVFKYRALLGRGFLVNFIGASQRAVLSQALSGEEAEGFIETLDQVSEQINNTPVTYMTDSIELDDKVVHLHYFRGGVDAYIVERDVGEDMSGNGQGAQRQAFGLVSLSGGGILEAQLGYVSIEELIKNGVELDLDWTPKTVGELKREAANGS